MAPTRRVALGAGLETAPFRAGRRSKWRRFGRKAARGRRPRRTAVQKRPGFLSGCSTLQLLKQIQEETSRLLPEKNRLRGL